ncbi:subtilisin-like protease, putative [Eimeria brunetti]|uniref:subtilisin n=1 Tax=Eimeria brunetti TaxID=51314 RepID=U6LG27_9EIME|nr:subtilisin-like protease, putative [Eimeria brunetti]
MASRFWSLALCLAVLGGYPPSTALRDDFQITASFEDRSNGSKVIPVATEAVEAPLPEQVDSPRRSSGPIRHAFAGPARPRGSIVHPEDEQSPQIEIHPSRTVFVSPEGLPVWKRNLRSGEPADLPARMRALSQAERGQRNGNGRPLLGKDSDKWEVGNRLLSEAPSARAGKGEFLREATLSSSFDSEPEEHSDAYPDEAQKHRNPSAGESADARMVLEMTNRVKSLNGSISIPSPLAHSLLYRTRDIANPLNFANFLAEGQEWLIPGTGSLWEGLGRHVDSLFSGLFLKTASILPNYKRNVIICYKAYKPSMWIEMFGQRNQFLRQLASLFQGTHRMQSVYLRNLGMEIFEVPPLWRVREFIATVLKLDNYVSHVYTDQLVSDFDNEIQAALPDNSSEGNAASDPSAHRHGDTNNATDAGEHRRASRYRAPSRRLEVMTNDPFTWQQWAIVDSGPTRWGIEAPNAWEVWTGQGLKPRFTVAVIDSGVDYEHPDLQNQIWRNPDEICGNGIDDDFNGFVDDCIGWDFVKGTNLPMDDNGHGTASAGIIAAEPNNGIGLTGVCWGCDILVLKALNEDIKGTISAFARSLDYAIGKGIMLSNNSYGGRGSGFRGLQEAVQRARQAGMIVVAAAGNYNGNNDNDKQPVFPASYDLDNVVSVAAISRNGQLAPFSSYGKKQVDVAAPGANIMTTSARRTYRSVSGTSFAVPMVTGTIALLWTRRPQLNYRQVINRLLRSVKKNPHLEGLIATGGTVDAWSTLAKEDILDPYAALPVLPMTCASASCSQYATCSDAQGTANGTFDCICPRGTAWNGVSGPAAQCLRINSPNRGPCAQNGGCGANSLCQALFTPEATRKCNCVNGFKPLRLGSREITAAMANSQMSSFDNTVCIREEILPEEQAYYIITMHRERLQHRRMSISTQTTAGHGIPTNMQDATQYSNRARNGMVNQQNLNHVPGSNISTPFTAGLLKKPWDSVSGKMSGVRVQRLMRLIDESRPFHHGLDGHASIRKLEMAYHEICLLAETSLMDLNADMILTFCLQACAHGDEEKATRVFQLFDQVGIQSPRTKAYGLLFRAYLETKQAQPTSVKGMVAVDRHVEALSFVEQALAIADEVTQHQEGRAPSKGAIEDAMQLCVEAETAHGHAPQWHKHHYILQRKLAMIRGNLGGRQDASGPISTKVEFPYWAGTVETAILIGRHAVKTAQAVGSAGPQKENAAGLKGEPACSELLKAWAILDPQLPQVVRSAFISRGTPEEVDDQLYNLQKSVEPPRNVEENEHFAAREPCPMRDLRVQAVRRLDECLTAMAHVSENGDLVEICAATMWNIARPCLGPEIRRHIYRSMQKASNALDRCQSSQMSLRLHLFHQLAQCEVEEELFKAAQTTINRALKIECCCCPVAYHKNEFAPTSQPATSASDNPVLATSCAVESEPSPAQLADSRSLSLSLERMAQAVGQITVAVENANPVDQIQNIAFRGGHDQSISQIIHIAEDLRKRAFHMLADDESKLSSRQLRVESHGTSKRAVVSPQQARTSVYRKPVLSLRGETMVKKIIASYGHLVSRARELGDDRAIARAATAVLSMVHGTEKCLDPSAFNFDQHETMPPVELRVRLRPPFETEIAVHVIEAAYALAQCCSKLKTSGCCGSAEVSPVGPAFEDSDLLQEEQPLLSKENGSGSTVRPGESALSEEQRLFNLLLFGARLSDAFGQAWLVFNAAVHTWNIYRSLLFNSPIKVPEISRLMPVLKELFQRLLDQPPNTCDAVMHTFTEFCSRSALEVPQPVLSRLLKTPSTATQETAGADKASKAKQAKGQASGVNETASMLKLTPDISVLLQIEKAILEKETSTREHLLLQCGDLLWSATTAMATPTSAELVGSVELLKTELWTRLAAAALSVNFTTVQGLSVAYAFQALGEKCCAVPYKIPSDLNYQLQLWRGVAHVLAGLSILSADFTMTGNMWAIRHLLQACEYGKEANCVPMLLFAAKALWNAAAPVMGDENNGEQAYLAVKASLYTIPTSYRPAATTLITRMCMGLLWSLPYGRKWDELFRTAEAAMLLVPKVLHTPLMKLQILALTRTETPNLFPTVCSLAKSEPSSEADLLLCFARLAQKTPGVTSMAMEAYEGALTLFEVDKDPHGILVHLEVAEWLLSMRRSWAKASSHIRAALELLKKVECQHECRLPRDYARADSDAQPDSGTSSTGFITLSDTVIRLDHLLLLQAQALKLFYSPDTSETAEAMKQIVSLSSQMLEAPAQGQAESASEQDRVTREEETDGAESSGEHTERFTRRFDPWASASLYDPIRLARFSQRGSSSVAAEGASLYNQKMRSSRDKGGLGSLLKSRAYKNAGIRDILLWSTSLTLAFRLLNKIEAHLFELGLETWSLRLTRLRAKVTEAFLLLSLQSNISNSIFSESGGMHPALSLLEASFNIQVFRGAVACRFLDEAQKLQPFFSPSALRAWIASLGPATEAGEGFPTAMGRQACCLSVVTLHRACCLISIGELLVTLGEQCLLIGEVGISSLLGCAASIYLPAPQILKDCNPNLYARQIAMLATSRFRQGDVDGSLQLLDTVINWTNFPQLELSVGLDVAEALWKIHAARGTVSKATPVMKQIDATLSELASATATSTNFEKSGTTISRGSSAPSGPQQTPISTTTRIEKGVKASTFSHRFQQSRLGRGAATAEVPQWPLSLTVWRHRLKGLEADHFFSLHCLGWTAEGGSLHIHWKRTFLEAVNLLSSLLDRTEELGVPLKPLRVCAFNCLRGARFLMAAMRFLWTDERNFTAYHWERRESPLTVSPNPRDSPLVTPADLQECCEALHRVLAGLDLEAKAILDFVAYGDKHCLTHQSALAWADMIALASAQLLCFRHQLQLVTLEFWRADIHQVLDGSQREYTGSRRIGPSSGAANCSHAKAPGGERRRALQQWLYESQYEDALSSLQMKSQQQCLEHAVQELEGMRTVGLCRRQTEQKSNCSEIWGKSLLDAQWACQCAMLRHHQLLLQARQRIIAQGRELHDLCPWIEDETEPHESRELWIEDIRSAVALADKTPKGQQRSLNYLASALGRDPREGRYYCIASPELEQTFLSCVISGHLTEATFLGEELIANILGNGNLEQLDKGFATIATLQATQVAQASKLLQLQFTNPHMAESVVTQELRILEESWREAGAVPQTQVIRRMLDTRPGFMQMANLADLTPSAILNSCLPRNCCVACLHCSRGFVFFAVACPSTQSDGSVSAWRFFLQRRALPECLLLKGESPPISQDPLGNKDIPKPSSASSLMYSDQVYAVLEDLFEALAAQMLYWSLATMLNQGQSATFGETRSHLLLLPDIRLSHFPFERMPTLKRLFGHRITRDFSLHMFARRMQHHDAVPAASQPRKTVAEMHTGFARESLVLLPESTAYPNLQNLGDSEHQPGTEEAQSDMPLAEDEYPTSTDFEKPQASLPKTVISPLLTSLSCSGRDWRLTVLAELAASKRSASSDASPAVPPSNSFVPELLCSKSPQVAWVPSLDQLVLSCEDINYVLAGMNLTHISLLGLVPMRRERTQFESVAHAGRFSDSFLYCQGQKVLGLSKGTETILMLSIRGVGTVAAVDEVLTDQQKVELAKRFLAEVAGAQTQVCSAVESLNSSSVEGGRGRLSTKRHQQHKVEQGLHEHFASPELRDYTLESEDSEKEGLARGMRIYGLPWIGRLATPKNASKAELLKAPSQRGRK